ncbi:MAG: transketolase family protein [Actinobacteria bacterium]|jgi:transketolase|nr:transketolase family protein [Actinomycetota bacterium]
MATWNKHVAIGPPAGVGKGIGKAMKAAFQKDPKALAILEDMQFPEIEWFVDNMFDRMIECGIAEQNAACVAAALASEGFTPVINNFLFAGMGRAYNQIRQSILVDRFNVKFIAREGVWGEVGVSHATVEGWGSLRVLPNLMMINPADAVEAEKAATAMMQYIGPAVIKQEMSPDPLTIFTADYPFDLGKAYSLRDGKDATIIATGYMVTEAVKAVDLLEEDGLDVGVLNVSTLKPIDEEAIVAAAKRTGAIVTAENSSEINGLGDAVACVLCENLPTPLVKVGVEDEFGQSGLITEEKDELMEHFALSAKDVADAVKKCILKREALR